MPIVLIPPQRSTFGETLVTQILGRSATTTDEGSWSCRRLAARRLAVPLRGSRRKDRSGPPSATSRRACQERANLLGVDQEFSEGAAPGGAQIPACWPVPNANCAFFGVGGGRMDGVQVAPPRCREDEDVFGVPARESRSSSRLPAGPASAWCCTHSL